MTPELGYFKRITLKEVTVFQPRDLKEQEHKGALTSLRYPCGHPRYLHSIAATRRGYSQLPSVSVAAPERNHLSLHQYE